MKTVHWHGYTTQFPSDRKIQIIRPFSSFRYGTYDILYTRPHQSKVEHSLIVFAIHTEDPS